MTPRRSMQIDRSRNCTIPAFSPAGQPGTFSVWHKQSAKLDSTRSRELLCRDALTRRKPGRSMREMRMFLLIYIILVGLVAGWATGKLMKGSGYGVLMDILLGIAGGIVGAFIMRVLGFYSSGGLISSILVAILGAVVLVAIARKMKRA